jgi:tetratricopeptide (TPR) repeat protein
MPRSLVLAVCLAVALPLSARSLELPKPTEKWVTLEVENFHFVSALAAPETRRIARDLLRMRAALGKVSDFNVQSDETTHVFVFATQPRFAPYCEAMLRSNQCEQVTGLFTDGRNGNYMLLSGDAKGGVSRVVYHELTHQLMANTSAKQPLWYQEGVAEYFSTFRTSGAEAHLGVVVQEHLRWLRAEEAFGSLSKRLIPLRELFAVTPASPIYNERTRTGVFYAESWALVHYLLHNDARSEKLFRFLGLLRGGKPVDEAFATAFAMPFSELERALRSYIRGDSFTYYARNFGELAIAELPEPAAMPHDDVLHQLGRLLVRMRPENAAVAERFFAASVAANDKNTGALANLAQLYDATGRKAEAEAAFAKAVELGSDDAEVYLLAGRSILGGEPSGFVKARPLFRRATELDPNSAAAWTGLGATYLGETSDRAAGIAALKKSLELDKTNEEAMIYLAQLWANDGRIAEARKLAQALLARTTDKTLQEQISRVLSAIDARESALLLQKAQASADHSLKLISEAVALVNAGKYKEALALVDAALPGLPNERSRQKARELRDLIAAEVKKGR